MTESASEPLEPDDGEPLAAVRFAKLRDVRAADLGVRFAFGAGASIAAAASGLVFDARVGGMFLAFPAILPATLTLLERRHGTSDAVHDARGAVLGSAGLVAFAIVATWSWPRIPVAAALGAATVAWAVVALGAYLAVAFVRRRRDAGAPHRRPGREHRPPAGAAPVAGR